MEILGEFDNESPLYISFCQRISPEDFERQSLTYTQKSLQDLYSKMEQNPGICESIVRKRKHRESKEAGLASYLKAKFWSLFNYTDPLEMEELREEVQQLQREMQRASNYAFAAKRVSQWQVERRARKNVPRGKFSQRDTKLPEPALPAMPKIFGPFPKQADKPTGSSNMELKHPWAGVSAGKQASMVDLHPLMPSGCRSSFLGSNSFGRPRPSSAPRTAANSPTESFHSDEPPSITTTLTAPAQAKPKGIREDMKESKNPGPGSHPAGA